MKPFRVFRIGAVSVHIVWTRVKDGRTNECVDGRTSWTLTLYARVLDVEVGRCVGLVAALEIIAAGELNRTCLVALACGRVDKRLTMNKIVGMIIWRAHLRPTMDFPNGYVG